MSLAYLCVFLERFFELVVDVGGGLSGSEFVHDGVEEGAFFFAGELDALLLEPGQDLLFEDVVLREETLPSARGPSRSCT